jgi:glycosyltransferase involved in cell wall biosynthesis
MLERIQDERITVCIPTMNRKKLLTRFVKNYVENCPLRTDFIFINSNVDQRCVDSNISHMIHQVDNGHTYIDHYIPPSSVGEARAVGMDIAKDIGNEFVFSGDDDSRVGEMAIEKMLAPIMQDDRFWKIGHLGGYRAFMRDFDLMEVRFHAVIGVLWVTTLSVLNNIGNIDRSMISREDNEFSARIWHEGGWTAIVDAKVAHTRHQPLEAGKRTIPENMSKGWMDANDLIADRFPDIFKHKSGKLYRQFKWPEEKFMLTDGLELVNAED